MAVTCKCGNPWQPPENWRVQRSTAALLMNSNHCLCPQARGGGGGGGFKARGGVIKGGGGGRGGGNAPRGACFCFCLPLRSCSQTALCPDNILFVCSPLPLHRWWRRPWRWPWRWSWSWSGWSSWPWPWPRRARWQAQVPGAPAAQLGVLDSAYCTILKLHCTALICTAQ